MPSDCPYMPVQTGHEHQASAMLKAAGKTALQHPQDGVRLPVPGSGRSP